MYLGILMAASITLIGQLTTAHTASLEAWLASYDITADRHVLSDNLDDYLVERWELSQPFSDSDEATIRKNLLDRSNQDVVDYVYQKHAMDIHSSGVAVFDMDSTLIKAEVMDELAVEAGIGEQIAEITASAMRGEIDFNESFVRRLSLLKGLDSNVMESVFARIEYMDGIESLMTVLNYYNWHTAILSGGFTFFAEKIKERFNFSEVHANVLEIIEGKLTGRHLGNIVDAKAKKQFLEEMLVQCGIEESNSIACGDGANDLLMLNTASLGVALHAKPIVREQSPHPINLLGLDSILYLLGMTSSQIRKIYR